MDPLWWIEYRVKLGQLGMGGLSGGSSRSCAAATPSCSRASRRAKGALEIDFGRTIVFLLILCLGCLCWGSRFRHRHRRPRRRRPRWCPRQHWSQRRFPSLPWVFLLGLRLKAQLHLRLEAQLPREAEEDLPEPLARGTERASASQCK